MHRSQRQAASCLPAQNVYRFEMQMPEFIEAHTAADDTRIEAQILLRVLRRKKKLHVVKNPRDFQSHIWEMFEVKGAS